MLVAAEVIILYKIFPSMIWSCRPVIVIVCAVFQFDGVKVNDEAETDPSVASEEEIPMETLAVGWEVSPMVKLSVLPASVVTLPLVGVTVIPATSLSIFVTDTSEGFNPM